MPGKKRRFSCYLWYTLLFLVTAILVFFYFYTENKSMVWNYDGVYQHFNSLVYFGKYLRDIVRQILDFQIPSIPLWDMCIGYGADILTTLNYYAVGDPLALLSVLVPAEKTEYLYAFLVILRLYLGGAAFLVYCRYHKNEDAPSVLGALTYCFSGFALFACARHPYFINPMIYFPLILLGIDKIFNGERPWLFIIMAAVSAVSNFYFFYMMCILMFVYAVFRYIRIFGKIRVRELISWLLRFIGYFAVGAGIAMFALLPAAMYVFGTGRMKAGHYIPFLYSAGHYARLLGDFFCVDYTMASSRYYTVLGLVPLLLAAVFVLLVKRKKYTDLKIGFLVLSLLLLIPFAGHVMNGFSYVSNRWIWGYDMMLSYILVKMIPEFSCLEKKERKALLALCVCYSIITAAVTRNLTVHVTAALVILLLCGISIILCAHPGWRKRMLPVFFVLVIGSVGMNAYYLYAPEQTNYIDMFRKQGKPYKMLTTKAQNYLVKEIGDDSGFYRYDQYGLTARENTAMQNRLYGTDFYFSVTNGATSQFFSEMYAAIPLEQMYDGLDSRTILDRLACVKYFIVKKDQTGYLPYGFTKAVAANDDFTVYQSEQVLPFGYTYEYAISSENYEALNVVQKQQALLQGAVVRDSSLEEAELKFSDERPEFTITADENVSVEGNTFVVNKKDAQITLDFAGKENSETYLILDNLIYEGSATKFGLKLSMENTGKTVVVYTDRNSFYSGKNDFLCNLGYHEEAPSSITLRFPAAGTYTVDEIAVVSQPMGDIDEQTELLKRDILENVRFSDNKIEGDITLDAPKILVLSMAYSKGWTAYVDGEKTELLPVNTMYCGLELEEGEHTVELCYRTPYLREGMVISFACLLILLIMIWKGRRKRKQTCGITKNVV